jgi:hypothetical protein
MADLAPRIYASEISHLRLSKLQLKVCQEMPEWRELL